MRAIAWSTVISLFIGGTCTGPGVFSSSLIFFFPPSSYDLISKCWQEPNGEDSDESARLQFQELEVRITVRGGEKQRQIENTPMKPDGRRRTPLLLIGFSSRRSRRSQEWPGCEETLGAPY